MAPLGVVLTIVSLVAPSTDVPDPCKSAHAPFPSRVEGVADDTIRALATYRESWQAACDPAAGPVDLEPLLGDAESLSADVILSRVLDVLVRFQPKGAPWPLPGVRRRGPSEFVADWAAFASMAAEHGMVDDQIFWRAASLVADADGDPAWLGAVPARLKDPCVRLGEVPWVEIATALSQMERSVTKRYAAHGRRLRERFVRTLEALGDGNVCGCVSGNATAGLEALAAKYEKVGVDTLRAIARAAEGAYGNVRRSRHVRWLRDSPNGPPTGCGAKAK